jgi:hypothetical protein
MYYVCMFRHGRIITTSLVILNVQPREGFLCFLVSVEYVIKFCSCVSHRLYNYTSQQRTVVCHKRNPLYESLPVTAAKNPVFLDLWFRASFSKYILHTKCPTRCNTSILILLQDHSTCFGYFLYPSSWVQLLQLTATGTTYVTLDRELCGNGDMTHLPIMDNF